MPAATVTMDTSSGRPQTRERYPDDRKGGSYFRRDQLEKKHQLPNDHRPTSCDIGRQSTRIQKEHVDVGIGVGKRATTLRQGAEAVRRGPETVGAKREGTAAVGEDRPPDRGARRHVGSGGRWGLEAVQVVRAPSCGRIYSLLESKNAHLEREQCGLVSKIVSIAALARRKHDRTESTTRLDYEQLFLQSSMPMAVAALDGKFTASNDRFAHVLGLREASAVVGRSVFDLASPMHLQRVLAASGRCCEVRNRSRAARSTARSRTRRVIDSDHIAAAGVLCGGADRARGRRPAAARGWLTLTALCFSLGFAAKASWGARLGGAFWDSIAAAATCVAAATGARSAGVEGECRGGCVVYTRGQLAAVTH